MAPISSTLTTDEVLQEIGARLRGYRLQQNRTLEEVAGSAGIGLRTAARTEAGERPTLATVVKMLRALGRLDTIDAFLPEPLVSPLEMAKLSGKVRERAGRPRAPRRDAAKSTRRRRSSSGENNG